MRAHCGADERKIGLKSFGRCHDFENLIRWRRSSKEVVGWELLGLPKGVATMIDVGQIIQSSGGCQKAAFLDVGADAAQEIIERGEG